MAEKKSAVGSDPLDSLDPDGLASLLGESPEVRRERKESRRAKRRERSSRPEEPRRSRRREDEEAAPTPSGDPALEEIVERGRMALEERAWGAAAEAFREALSRDPHDTRAIVGLADALLGGGDRERAVERLLEGEEIAPDDPEIKVRLGRCYALAAAYPEAEAVLRRALRLSPRDAGARCELGIVLVKKGLYRDGIEELERALSLDDGETRAHYYLGLAHNQLDRLDRAAEAFERAVSADPEDDRAYYQLGIIYDRRGMTDRAREMYRKAREVEGRTGG
ncbi:MAG: tetratricopeptide repeat protein [Gemmatimonadota bacterium]|nr:tetratricopeptide repeat protein [Gemmatimonadota bacterium]